MEGILPNGSPTPLVVIKEEVKEEAVNQSKSRMTKIPTGPRRSECVPDHTPPPSSQLRSPLNPNHKRARSDIDSIHVKGHAAGNYTKGWAMEGTTPSFGRICV
jgi:hypothetical protein